MKRVLMVSHCYPPMASPGALRSAKFAKYLPEFGWEPVVLAPRGGYSRAMGMAEDEGVRVVRTRDLGGVQRAAASALHSPAGVRTRVVRAFKGLVYPDRVGAWYPFAMAAGARLLRGERFDALYSTSPSVANHVVAMHLSRMFGVPWVADFRDLWTLAPHYEKGSPARVRLDRRLERRIVAHAHRVVTVSDYCVRTFRAEYPGQADKMGVIRNGYDPDDLPPPAPLPPGPFVLTYAGLFYGGRRDPRGLFRAIAALRDEGTATPERFRMDLVGDPDPEVLRMVDEAGVGALVRPVGRLPYHETLARLSASSALCVITLTDKGSEGEMTTKLFEYIGVGRPILAVAVPRSELGEVVRSGGLGGVFEHGDAAGMAEWLRAGMRAGPAAAAPPPPQALYPYTRRALAQALAGQLDGAAAAALSS